MLYPLTFDPIYKERPWGRRTIQTLYGKPLPDRVPIGESWEISDRSGDVSVVDRGPLAGRDLHWLITHHADELLGDVPLSNGNFPLLAKILDAQERLSLQVHPPVRVAVELHGEPKTEMWLVTNARPGAELFVGLRRGVNREQFEANLREGTVAECFHRVPVQAGDAMFVPSGRVHAIGGGCVIFEIQQNSDTTYRVFDWNRVGLDGKPRELHIPQSLRSIDFHDVEPDLIRSAFVPRENFAVRPLVTCDHFEAEIRRYVPGAALEFSAGPLVLAVVQGELRIADPICPALLKPGQFCLLPASLDRTLGEVRGATDLLVVKPK